MSHALRCFMPALALPAFLALPALPALAAPAPQPETALAVETLIGDAGALDADGRVLVDLRFLNGTATPQPVILPDRIEARLEPGGGTVWIERAATSPARLEVAPGSFARAQYRLPSSPLAAPEGLKLSIPAWSRQQVVVRAVPTAPRVAAVDTPMDAAELAVAAPPPSDLTAGNAFVANLSAYEPIYAVYGPGTDSEARIQFSFKYQLFGSRRTEGLPRSWRDGLHFAYTQRMLWDLGAQSSPFRNIDYQPELIYITPSASFASGITLSGQAGIRHESNGRDGDASRSINSVYVAPMAAIPLGGRLRLTVAPRLQFYVGDRSDNPDIARYRGNTGLFLELGEDEGWRLSTTTRFNFSRGKGALNADVSYPLARLLGGGPDFYLFGQSFVGYGENLLDYDKRMTRFRIGLALVR